MSSTSSYPRCSVELHPDLPLGRVVVSATLLLLAWIPFCNIVPGLGGVVTLLVCVVAHEAVESCLLRSPDQVRQGIAHADGRWTVTLNDARDVEVIPCSGLVATPELVAVCFRGEVDRFYLLLTPGNSSIVERRRFAVRLRSLSAMELSLW